MAASVESFFEMFFFLASGCHPVRYGSFKLVKKWKKGIFEIGMKFADRIWLNVRVMHMST